MGDVCLRICVLPTVSGSCMVWISGILMFLILLERSLVSAVQLNDIFWNSTNAIFRPDNPDHIIDVNRGNIPFEYDQVNIICPVYSPGTREDEIEKYIIYNVGCSSTLCPVHCSLDSQVSKEEYETCRITNSNPRVIAVCDKPFKVMYFTITFRSFTPQPAGMEFLPGQDYYFISTSSNDDLHRRVAGRCKTNNMKIVFKICCKPQENSSKNSINSRRGMGMLSTPLVGTQSTSYARKSITFSSFSYPSSTSAYLNFPVIKHNFEVPILGMRPTTKRTANYAGTKNLQIAQTDELNFKSSQMRLRHEFRLIAAAAAVVLAFVVHPALLDT